MASLRGSRATRIRSAAAALRPVCEPAAGPAGRDERCCRMPKFMQMNSEPERPIGIPISARQMPFAWLGAKKADFDLNRGVWIKPSHQTKQERTEHLPLSAPAVALVASLAKSSPAKPHLFAGNVEGEPLRDVKKFWASVMLQADIRGYRRHDNRHTYASHLVSSGLSLEIVGRLLGHIMPPLDSRRARQVR
jgi:hypothetical protein